MTALGVLLRLSSRFLCLWPERLLDWDARFWGFVWFSVIRYRRRVILENLERAFPDASPRERRRLGRKACTHLVRTLFDFARMPLYAKRGFSNVEVEGLENYRAAKAGGKGIIVLTGHLGSFELGAAASARASGETLHMVVKPFPAGVQDFVDALRHAGGVHMISAKDGLKNILRALAGNEAVALVIDQNATRKLGVFVDFFGHRASTFSSVATLAIRTGASVLPTSTWRRPNGTHVFRVHPPLPLEPRATRDETVQHMTQVYTKFIEARILEHPEQWFWTHRRWKTQPRP